MTASEVKKIVEFVEGPEHAGARLDNLAREPRYQYAKGFLEIWAVAEKLAEALNKLFLDKWCLDEDKEKRDEALALYDQFK